MLPFITTESGWWTGGQVGWKAEDTGQTKLGLLTILTDYAAKFTIT